MSFDPSVIIERCQVHGDDAGRSFRENTGQALREMHAAVSALERNPMKNAAQVKIEAAAMVRKRAEARNVLFDVNREGLRKRQADVAARVANALRPPNPAEAQEIRAVLRSMSEKERYDLINRAEGTDDHLSFLFAIAGVPAALSGLSPGKVLEAKNTLLALKDPELLTLPAQLAKESTLLDKCERGFNDSVDELVDFDAADALRQLAEEPQ